MDISILQRAELTWWAARGGKKKKADSFLGDTLLCHAEPKLV